MSGDLASAVYEGRVQHRRHRPTRHAFSHGLGQLWLDLDEIDRVFDRRWLWSVDRRNVAEFRRRDYLDGDDGTSLAESVRSRVCTVLGHAPTGPVRLLTHPRYFGHVFNPVSFYYCYRADGVGLDAILAEITNTPWQERHAYVLDVGDAQRRGNVLEWDFDKRFHVSPFMAMARRYRWRFTVPGEVLGVHMQARDGEDREFDATLSLKRRPLDGRALARLLWRYPLMTAQVVGAIHWQALRLWLKRTPVHDHPRHAGDTR